jgi:hypothetical protein
MNILYKIPNCFLSALILFSCHGYNAGTSSRKDAPNSFSIPVIIDTFKKTEQLKNVFSITLTEPVITAVKPFGDTCFIIDEPYNIRDTSINRNVEQRPDGLQLLVDTTQSITLQYNNKINYYNLDDTSQKFYKGLPCFIYNETSSIKWLRTQDSKIIVIQEAMDSNYNWRPIQIWQWSWCGNSYYRAFIKPNHYLLFKIPLYAGKYYTDIRLKLHSGDATYYSNEYKGWLNYKQFDLPKELMNKDGKPGFNLSYLSNN